MPGLTDAQHSSLLCWLRTVGTRPGKPEKCFFEADKGLSADQIDAWWDNNVLTREIKSRNNLNSGTPLPAVPSDDGQKSGYGDGESHLSLNGHAAPANFEKSNPLSRSQQHHHLSYSSSSTGNSAFYDSRSSGCSVHSWASKYTDGSTAAETMLLDMGPGLTDSCTSQYSFSMNYNIPNDTQSSAFLGPDDFELMAPILSGQPPGHSEPICSGFPKTRQDVAPPVPLSSRTPSRAEPCPKTEKVPGRFVCTACHLPFTTKGDWKRHEGSQCEPQTSWICMLDGYPAIPLGGGWQCAFCDLVVFGPERTQITMHLVDRHKFNLCARKSLEQRSFKRKDKLKDHLQRKHNLSESSTHWEKWRQGATQEKSAWGCGFCGCCLSTWDERMEHIGSHYETHNFSIAAWSHSNVIRGLLKQADTQFNILQVWSALVEPGSDQVLVWSPEDALVLKEMLEFRKGTPKQLALEARKLAKNLDTVWNEKKHMHSRRPSGQSWKDPPGISPLNLTTTKQTSQGPQYTEEAVWKGWIQYRESEEGDLNMQNTSYI